MWNTENKTNECNKIETDSQIQKNPWGKRGGQNRGGVIKSTKY